MLRYAARGLLLASIVTTIGASPSPSPSASQTAASATPRYASPVPRGASPRPSANLSAAPSTAASGSAASPSAASASPSLGPAPSIASVASRFSGVWRCEGYAPEDSGTQSFMREASDTIALIGVYDSGKLEADRFSFDVAHAVWQLSTVASLRPLLASPATGDRWIFSGEEGDRRQPHAVRIVYTALGPTAFRREHQTPVRDGWTDDGEAVCRRTSVMSTTASSPVPTRRPVVIARVARPSPSPSPTPARDRAYRLLGATWDCETIEGNSAPHTYRLAADGSMLLHTMLSVGSKSYPIDERYRFDRSQNQWTATTLGTSYSSTAPPWLDDKWIFNGVEMTNGVRVTVRMIYTELDEHAFRRDFRRLQGTEWQTIASETCSRR